MTEITKEQENALQKLDSFIDNRVKVLDLILQPPTAGTENIIERVSFLIRKKIEAMAPKDEVESKAWLDSQYTTWSVAIFLYVHSISPGHLEKVQAESWDIPAFMKSVEELMGNYTTDELFSTLPVLLKLRDNVNRAKRFEVASKGDEKAKND
jgi:hypothetical protein